MGLSEFDRENIPAILSGHGDWFTAQLLRLITKADPCNRALLAKGFPEEVWLVETHLGRTPTTRLEVA